VSVWSAVNGAIVAALTADRGTVETFIRPAITSVPEK
jgi:hypothetical protein